ncbi:MAG: glycosyltransferase [Renibacterium sp.]|nr:glycosyltransferase [Renibacterium sp.]
MTGAGPVCRTVAVLVSYNRKELLTKAVAGLLSADRLPDALVVVDNASTDGAVEWLRALQLPFDYELVELSSNTGGAGGFAVGMAHALANHDPDLVWIMDDDTEPHADTLSEALRLWAQYPSGAKPALIASRVLWTDGRDHPMNTPRTKPGATASELAAAAKSAARPVRSASFVSLFIDAEAIRENGLPIVDYFLWNDDFEFSTRLVRDSFGLASQKSAVSHHTKVFDSNTVDVGERFYFEVRNKLWLFSRSRALRGGEKLLYGASTIRRWALMVSRSSRKRVVLRAGLRGLRDGLRTAPRDNDTALAGIHRLPEWKLGRQLPASAAVAEAQDFSVLLPVYAGDDPELFRRALASVSDQQTRKPAEIVIVQDGAVPPGIEKILLAAEQQAAGKVRVLRLPRALGLAGALDAGLLECRYDIVARMDADDVSLPRRFEVQVPYLEAGYDIVGSAIEEIGDDDSQPLAYRPVVTDQAALAANSGFRSPFHHPSVVYRKSRVLAVGGYGDLLKIEDFWLWLRMLRSGAKAANVPEALVRYRVSEGAYRRRGGLGLLAAEFRLQGRLRRAGYISSAQWLRNVAVRCGYRLVPTGIRRSGYRAAFTSKR